MRQKVKPYFLPVQLAKKDRQSLSFFGEKGNATPRLSWFLVWSSRFGGKALLCLQTQTHPAKSRVLLFAAP
jgi:hypothetical protein